MMVYIAGPMSGIPEHNYPAFDAAATTLRAEGYIVHSPADMSRESGTIPNADGTISRDEWQGCLRMDLVRILESCDTVFVLRGWWNSRGAKLEVLVAQSVGIATVDFETREELRYPAVDTKSYV